MYLSKQQYGHIKMQLNHYLNFQGKTEAAFNFYKSVFGGEFSNPDPLW